MINKTGAEFKVVKIDPEGSGMDYQGHLGATVLNARRCCKNCCVIFGTIDNYTEFGPFIPGELIPLNSEAEDIQNEIAQFLTEETKRSELIKKRKIVYSEEYLKSYQELTGRPHKSKNWS